MEKVCKECRQTKPLDDFGKHSGMRDGHLNICKTCRTIYMKNYKKVNGEEISVRMKNYYKENQEKMKEASRERWDNNKKDINDKRRERYKNDAEHRAKVLKRASESNAIHRPNRRLKSKLNREPQYIMHLIRKRLYNALNGKMKSHKTVELIGCEPEFVSQYLENLKAPNKDYSDMHIDHIIPISWFDLELPEMQRACSHYTNLQPLTAKENSDKGNKVCLEYLEKNEGTWSLPLIFGCASTSLRVP